MARRGIEIDWVVVRVNTLRRVVALGATGLVAAALLAFGYSRLHLPPEAQARRAIEHAQRIHDAVAAKPVPRMWQTEFRQASQQLDESRSAYSHEQWPQALTLAEKSARRLEAIRGAGEGAVVGAGQILSYRGSVSVQRAGKADWVDAQLKMPVFNGDFVRTGDDGTAEILFADGTLYRISPDSLLEIHHQPARAAPGRVKMVVGHINVYTSTHPSTVATDTLEARVARDSRVAVDVKKERSAIVAAYAGAADVRSSGGNEVQLHSRERVAVSAEGALTDKGSIPEPPRPLEPGDNATIDMAANPNISLTWQPPAAAVTSHLQVSHSPRFLGSTMEIDAPGLSHSQAKLKIISPGTYFWRVAVVDTTGTRSEWSGVRRFRILSPHQRLPMEDRTPPELEVQPARQMGQLFIVEGRTEVGATVTINDEEVNVDADGHFRKAVEVPHDGWNDLVIAAVDPAGNRTERRQRVYVEVY